MPVLESVDDLPIGTIIMGFVGGLALFLFGLDQMTYALRVVAGNGLRRVLARMTANRFMAAFAGAFITAVVQSSSVTTVLVVGFVSAGLMTLAQSIGVIMGANVGTTIATQLIAFKITHFGLYAVAAGFAVQFIVRQETIRSTGRIVMGLGLVFFGMHLMSDAATPLRTYEPFIDLMRRMDNAVLAIVVSAAFTALVQASGATAGVVIVLAGQGFLTLDAGIALILGANVGTCITAMLAAIGKPREAVRAAVAHVLFNVAGVALWFAFIDQLAWLTQEISPTSGEADAAARASAEMPRQIANAHTIFNVANTMLFIWFTGPIAAIVGRVIPERRERKETTYLDEVLLRTPSLAVHMIRLELGRLGTSVLEMVRGSLETVISGSSSKLAALGRKDVAVDLMHASLVGYLGRLSQQNLSKELAHQVSRDLAAANYLENIGDMVETNLVEAGSERLEHEITFSEGTQEILRELHAKIIWSVERAIEALVAGDRDIAHEVAGAKEAINELVDRAEEHLMGRLTAGEPNRLEAFRVESDLVENLKRIYYFAKRIAKLVAEDESGRVSSNSESNDRDHHDATEA